MRKPKQPQARNNAALYNYQERPIGATPGVGNFAFLPSFGLPLSSVGGRGNAFYTQWGFLPPNLYYGQEQVVSGIEGVYAPGFNQTPLIDMEKYIAELSAMDQSGRGVEAIAKE